jgi:hypothetical protein
MCRADLGSTSYLEHIATACLRRRGIPHQPAHETTAKLDSLVAHLLQAALWWKIGPASGAGQTKKDRNERKDLLHKVRSPWYNLKLQTPPLGQAVMA